MNKSASLPVRLDPALDDRVNAIARRIHLTKSAIIRMLLESFAEHVERNGGRVTLPPEWRLDGTMEYPVEQSPRMKVAEERVEYGGKAKRIKP